VTDERVLNGRREVSRAAAPLVDLAMDRVIESALVITLLRILTMRLRERTRRLEDVELRLGALLRAESAAGTSALPALETRATVRGDQAQRPPEPEGDNQLRAIRVAVIVGI
jgi:hypothetical protein